MPNKILNVFIDESGDFGCYSDHSPYYIVVMVLHDQKIDISSNIANFEAHLCHLGYAHHSIHTGPLIRRESTYKYDEIENRKRIFNSLFHFTRQLKVAYICVEIKKIECIDSLDMAGKLSKSIADILWENKEYGDNFDRIIVYYDNGQIELTKILVSVFNSIFSQVEFRKVKPVDYKLFQVADLICTLELIAVKAETGKLSSSELEFFGNIQTFRKSYLRQIRNKRL